MIIEVFRNIAITRVEGVGEVFLQTTTVMAAYLRCSVME